MAVPSDLKICNRILLIAKKKSGGGVANINEQFPAFTLCTGSATKLLPSLYFLILFVPSRLSHSVNMTTKK